eukprot:jgi/Mesvir1/531/Mv11392-RA.1
MCVRCQSRGGTRADMVRLPGGGRWWSWTSPACPHPSRSSPHPPHPPMDREHKRKEEEEEGEGGGSAGDDASSGEDETKRAPKKAKPAPAGSSKKKPLKAVVQPDGTHSIEVCELGNKRMLHVQKWKGKVLVSIREYYESGGELRPGKKGISLTAEQWAQLRDHVDDVEEAIKQI